MQINLEPSDNHAIQAYSDKEIRVAGKCYDKSLIILRNEIIVDWPVHSLRELNETTLQPMLSHPLEVIIVGQTGALTPPPSIAQYLSQKRIGLECMSIGAACRTFNILLNEGRAVAAAFIL